MASTYTTNGGIELIANGEQSGTWGTTTNLNLQIIDRLTNGVGTISLSGTTHTLTTSDGALSDGQYAVLVFGGSPSGTNTVTISPNDAQHVYIVRNTTAQSVVLTQGSGGNVTVASGDTKVVYSSGAGAGAAVVDITADFAMSSVKITGGSITGITDLAPADGGTGISTVPSNGQLLIGNGTNYTAATLTAGTGISVTNGSGSVTVNATNNGTVTSVGGTGNVNGITLTGTVTSSGSLTLGGTLSGVNLTSQVTGTLPVANGGTGITSFGTGIATFLGTPTSANLAAAVTNETGSGSLVFATSPTLVTPVLGTPTSGDLSNCTADGTDSVGFRNIPQNSRSAAYTLVLADSGKHILHPSADTTARTFTIPANSSVAFPVGTAITFINQNGAGVVTIAITTDTMRLAGDGATGSRTLDANGVATCIKITSTEWIISGVGLT